MTANSIIDKAARRLEDTSHATDGWDTVTQADYLNFGINEILVSMPELGRQDDGSIATSLGPFAYGDSLDIPLPPACENALVCYVTGKCRQTKPSSDGDKRLGDSQMAEFEAFIRPRVTQ